MDAVCPITGQKGADGVACPVIKGLNEEEASQIQDKTQVEDSNKPNGDGNEISDIFDFDADFNTDIPSVAVCKKLRRIMKLITSFYRNGTNTKREQYLALEEDVTRISEDINQCKEQLAALNSDENERFRGHLKWKEYVKELEEEEERLNTQKTEIVTQRDHYKNLSSWSERIVEICEWLEQNLDDYCRRNISELPENLAKECEENASKLRPLTDTEVEQYSKGLDEIAHNLGESRDFFEASVDGRMQQYQQLHAEIIHCQLKTLEKYPKENPRREYFEDSLAEDLEYVEKQIREGETQPVKNRRERMLKMHRDFLQVLKFFTDKLQILKLDPSKRSYDPQFTDFFSIQQQ